MKHAHLHMQGTKQDSILRLHNIIIHKWHQIALDPPQMEKERSCMIRTQLHTPSLDTRFAKHQTVGHGKKKRGIRDPHSHREK